MDKKRIGLGALVMMMFTTIFGFANGPVAFARMGYAAIIWYILGALLFFLPTSMMYAEFGASFKDAKGGIYSWMERSLGKKIAFIATFIGLASWIIWMISVSQKVWIPLSTLIFGKDMTTTWSLFGMNGGQTGGILAVIFVIVVAFFVTRGVKSISRISAIGGMFVMALNVILVLASIAVLIGHGGHFAEPLRWHSFLVSGNPDYKTIGQMISFALYAIFAYAGLEQMGGIMEDVDNAEKTYPKAALIATTIIGLGYAISILLWGASSNWAQIAGDKSVNLGNITYVLMNNLGTQLGDAFGMSHAGGVLLGSIFARFAGISMFFAYVGSFFVLTYAPLKSFILGSPKEVWPKKFIALNKHDVPAVAVWSQAILVSILIILISFGGKSATQLYLVLTNMGNVSSTLPYVFLVAAFPLFKRLNDVERPFVFYKSQTVTWIITILVEALTIISIILTIISPFQTGDLFGGIWTVAGPIFFGVLAWVLFTLGENRHGKL
ncbi:glutamate/gamma-aminobutyrate family transporter YjeM [Weissella cibaria]|uniref:glutamate/gamma-aminobutyrate family transporter YjeM n=1 Tax=Weissella cibaria TaxID=137591 RepID=UPI0016818216|nr:glutamate/gamma-aminobutyrate family transporter YjeM [Weissella cibaria]MBD1501933.1 glutamate/gamma-aminobutyrate family transporter YjeM [Weissella cibaria]